MRNIYGLNFKNFVFLTLAGVVNAVGVTLFLTPVRLLDSGFSGTSILLSYLTPLSLSLWLLILNLPFYLFGFKKLGFPFIVYSLYAIGMYSLWSFLFQNVLPLDFSAGSPIAGGDVLLCALFGGLVSGVGSGLVIRFGGAIDGVEVLAIVFAKRLSLSVGTFVMIFNAALYILSGILLKSFTLPLYSLVAYAVGVKAVDFVVEGLDKGKSAFIVTDSGAAVAEALSAELGRGVTVLDAEGYYSKDRKKVVYCVVNRFELGKFKKIVFRADPTAFVAVSDVSESFGTDLGFHALFRRKKEFFAPETAGKERFSEIPETNAPPSETERQSSDTPSEQDAIWNEPDSGERNSIRSEAIPEKGNSIQNETMKKSSDADEISGGADSVRSNEENQTGTRL